MAWATLEGAGGFLEPGLASQVSRRVRWSSRSSRTAMFSSPRRLGDQRTALAHGQINAARRRLK